MDIEQDSEFFNPILGHDQEINPPLYPLSQPNEMASSFPINTKNHDYNLKLSIETQQSTSNETKTHTHLKNHSEIQDLNATNTPNLNTTYQDSLLNQNPLFAHQDINYYRKKINKDLKIFYMENKDYFNFTTNIRSGKKLSNQIIEKLFCKNKKDNFLNQIYSGYVKIIKSALNNITSKKDTQLYYVDYKNVNQIHIYNNLRNLILDQENYSTFLNLLKSKSKANFKTLTSHFTNNTIKQSFSLFIDIIFSEKAVDSIQKKFKISQNDNHNKWYSLSYHFLKNILFMSEN